MENICNVNFGKESWSQASLPMKQHIDKVLHWCHSVMKKNRIYLEKTQKITKKTDIQNNFKKSKANFKCTLAVLVHKN